MKFDVGRRKLAFFLCQLLVGIYSVIYSETRLLETKSEDCKAYLSTARLIVVNLYNTNTFMYECAVWAPHKDGVSRRDNF